MKSRYFRLAQMVVFLTFTCLFTFQAYARQVTCPRCGGTGMIPGPVIHGIQSYYGCPNCGGSGGGGSPGVKGRGWIEVPDAVQPDTQGNQPPPSDTEAERQRALEEQQKRAREEAARKQAEEDAKRKAAFEEAKQDALRSMKGIAENELGLKGLSTSGDLGLKGIGETKTLFERGTRDSAPVDIRAKGPSKLDLPGGKDILNPAINNANYKQGYDALRNSDPEAALRYFEQAQKELPNDRMVRDALVMVRGMRHLRQEEDNARNRLLGATSSAGANTQDEIKQFLFPDTTRKPFPDNPDKPLLNPLIEQKKAASLPARGETADDFAARFTKTDLYNKIDQMTSEEITPWNTGPIYPRGKYPEVDKVVDATIDRVTQLQGTGIRDACRKAVEEMNAEYARMEKAGLIKPGEDLNRKEATDSDYGNAMMNVRHRIYEQLGRDIGDVMLRNQIALDRLTLKIPEMQKESWDAKSEVEKYLFPGDNR